VAPRRHTHRHHFCGHRGIKFGGGEHIVFHVATIGQQFNLAAETLLLLRSSCHAMRPRPLPARKATTHVALQQKLIKAHHEALAVSVTITMVRAELESEVEPH